MNNFNIYVLINNSELHLTFIYSTLKTFREDLTFLQLVTKWNMYKIYVPFFMHVKHDQKGQY